MCVCVCVHLSETRASETVSERAREIDLLFRMQRER